jgi:hypothetical protein
MAGATPTSIGTDSLLLKAGAVQMKALFIAVNLIYLKVRA